nr:hypothetical protein [Mycobacterium sp. UM_NZ2]
MSAKLVAVGVDIRWYRRSIERRFDEKADEWASGDGNRAGVVMSFNITNGIDADEPFLAVQIVLKYDEPRASAAIDGEAKFEFDKAQRGSPDDQILVFLRDEGIPYLLGMERGVLADLTRQMGLPAGLLPPTLPDGLDSDLDRMLAEANAAST